MEYVAPKGVFSAPHSLLLVVEGSGMRNAQGLYNDGLVFGTCVNNGEVRGLLLGVLQLTFTVVLDHLDI